METFIHLLNGKNPENHGNIRAAHSIFNTTERKREKSLLLEVLSKKLSESEDSPNLIPWDLGKSEPQQLGNFFCLICLKAKIATEEEEPLLVATLLASCTRAKPLLPELAEDQGLQFCAKALTCLALFREALQRRCDRHGASAPHTYRKHSQTILASSKNPTREALASHHRNWENFLEENIPLQ